MTLSVEEPCEEDGLRIALKVTKAYQLHTELLPSNYLNNCRSVGIDDAIQSF